jgi:hypothetical protein
MARFPEGILEAQNFAFPTTTPDIKQTAKADASHYRLTGLTLK